MHNIVGRIGAFPRSPAGLSPIGLSVGGASHSWPGALTPPSPTLPNRRSEVGGGVRFDVRMNCRFHCSNCHDRRTSWHTTEFVRTTSSSGGTLRQAPIGSPVQGGIQTAAFVSLFLLVCSTLFPFRSLSDEPSTASAASANLPLHLVRSDICNSSQTPVQYRCTPLSITTAPTKLVTS